MCLLVKIVVSYPTMNYPARVTLQDYVCEGKEPTASQHVCIIVIPWALCFAVACFVTDVASVLAFVGAVSRTSVFFLFPAMMMLRSHRIGCLSRSELLLCRALLVLGLVAMVLGVVSAARNLS